MIFMSCFFKLTSKIFYYKKLFDNEMRKFPMWTQVPNDVSSIKERHELTK